MKALFRISIWLNVALVGGLIYSLASRPKGAVIPSPATPDVPVARETASAILPEAPMAEPEPFHWRQLESTKSYRIYIANLRASGCPEPTIQDIVRGDTERAFAYERRQLGLDGTGDGPWSQSNERRLVASLLRGRQPDAQPAAPAVATQNPATTTETTAAAAPTPSAGAAPAAYPLFLQKANLSAMGFDAGAQAAIAQARQQFENEVNALNPSPNDPANPDTAATTAAKRWQTAVQNADNLLRDSLGAQGYMAYEQQQYYLWFQPQVMANAGGGNLTINPDAFSVK